MPGSSWRFGFATVASTCTLRVAASTFGLIALILPREGGRRERVDRDVDDLADREPGQLLLRQR